LLGAAAKEEPPALLAEAVAKLVANDDCWACTQTDVSTGPKGKEIDQTVSRIDPSQPSARQSALLQKKGKPAEAGDSRKFAADAEKSRQANKSACAAVKDWSLGRARLLTETDATADYEIPTPKLTVEDLPYDKFRLVVRVNKKSHTVETTTLTSIAKFRLSGLTVKSMEIVQQYAEVAPDYPPALVSCRSTTLVSVLLLKVPINTVTTFSEFKRVQPPAETPLGDEAVLRVLF
jgi:hypothetical protein